MNKISTNKTPKPADHYSQEMAHGGLVYVSGQPPINPESGEKVTSTVEEQTIRVLESVKELRKQRLLLH